MAEAARDAMVGPSDTPAAKHALTANVLTRAPKRALQRAKSSANAKKCERERTTAKIGRQSLPRVGPTDELR
jgi:hypothetical protein